MKLELTLFAIGVLLTNLQMVESQKEENHGFQTRKSNCDCGQSGQGVSNRIVGGEISVPHIFPWIVAILNQGSNRCGGTLINDRYVLTAAHCVYWTDHADLSIGLGIHDIEDLAKGIIAPIDEVIIHGYYESSPFGDAIDMALIRLQYPVQYSETINPICLPSQTFDYTGREVKVAGWGRVNVVGDTSRILRHAKLRVMAWGTCKNFVYGDQLTDSLICAYAENMDACGGDSGGPLLHERYPGKYEIIGIVSHGLGCGEQGFPGLYTDVSRLLRWIHAITSYDSRYCS